MAAFSRQMQEIANTYLEEHDGEATTREIAEWAIRAGLWHPHADAAVRQCAEQLGKAMREKYFKDSQGRRVRSKHVARIKRGAEQVPMWSGMRTASRKHMEIAFKQRREQIVGDCVQLKQDVDSFNENFNSAEPVQIVFDFRDDLEERLDSAA